MKSIGLFLSLFVVIIFGDELNIENYLTKFGYYNPHAFDGSRNLTNAITDFQMRFHLPPTGIADKATVKLMKTPRCGVTDRLRLGYANSKWTKNALTYYFNNYSPDLGKEKIRSLTYLAFKKWADVTPLRFNEGYSDSDIRIHFGSRSHHDGRKKCYFDFDGNGGVLAHAFFPLDGRLHFDEDEHFTTRSTQGTNYLSVATHEIGHVLGLEHDTNDRSAIMYPYYQPYKGTEPQLGRNDIRRIQQLYGSTTSPVKPTKGPQGCHDSSADCNNFLDKCDGYSKEWTKYMTTYCAKSCRKCGTTTGGCEDKNTDCSKFKNQCTRPDSNDWKDYMNRYCKFTCNRC